MKAKDKITKARAGLVLDQPFFGALALRLKLKEDDSCGTAWTDGVSLGYNPGFIDTMSLDDCKAILAHEVMHCAAAHHARRNSRDHKKWNVAGDYAINGILENAGFHLPAGALLDQNYNDMSADAIYSSLPDSPDDGSGDDPGGMGEIRDTPGKGGGKSSQTEQDQAAQDWKVATNQAAQQAKNAGNLPAGLDRFVDELINPKVEWPELLRQFIDQAAKNDYAWTPPNRRFIHLGMFLPSLRSEELGNLIVAIDTSCSVTEEELKQFAGEISGILESFQVNIDVLYCDTDIAGHEHFTSQDLPISLHPKGGGGTRFTPVFDWIEESGKLPTCLVYLTDMECYDYPENAPEYPVLWIDTGGHGGAPFGEIIELN